MVRTGLVLMLLDTSLLFKKIDSMQRVDMIQKPFLFVVLIFFLLSSSLAYADGLFDFQMKLAKKGNAEAEFKVGEMYETGFGVKKNMKEALVWTNKAAAQGHETAGFKLTYWNIRKNGLKGANKKKFNDLGAKATAGNLQAMYYVGMMYSHGVGVEKNYDKALDWLNKATFGGVLAAEREAVRVRELKQNALNDQRKTQEKSSKADEEKRLKAEAAKMQNKQKVLEDKKELAAAKEAWQKQQAEKKAKAASAKKKQAYLKRQAEQKSKENKDSRFEADPCSGRSARFLSTCR